MIDQSVGTRVEGDLLKVQQKKFFRSFYSCGSCEERRDRLDCSPDSGRDSKISAKRA